MSTVLTTILIAAPLAFLAGWLLGKALFTHLAVTRPNPATAVQAPTQAEIPTPTTEPENATAQRLQKKLRISQADSQAALAEAALLKDTVAKREHQLTELRQRLETAQHKMPPEHDKAGAEAIQNVTQAKEVRALQQRAEGNEHEVVRLRRELVSATQKLESFQTRAQKWRRKLKPLAKQFRQQRIIISELREELRQRELQREQEALRNQQSNTEQSPATAPPVVRHDAPASPAVLEEKLRANQADPAIVSAPDNLEDLHGIGPAVHKKLNAKGVDRLQQLADMSSDEIAKLGRSVGVSMKLIRKHDWGAQARRKLDRDEPAAVTA